MKDLKSYLHDYATIDYNIYPSMIVSQSCLIWFNNNIETLSSIFTKEIFVLFHPINVMIQLFVFGIDHLYGYSMIQIKQNMLYLINQINEHLLIDKDFYRLRK